MNLAGAPARRDAVVALVLFVFALAVFVASPRRTPGDSQYSLLLSEQLLTRQTFALEEHFRMPLDPQRYPGINGTRDPYPYQVESVRSHAYYFFPIGSSVLSVPLVAVLRAFGLSSIAEDGGYDAAAETTMQALIAGALMAALAVVFFATARLLLSRRASVVVALVGALGTQVWSTGSRALWSDTWGIFLLGLVVFVLLAREAQGAPTRPALLATLVAWMYVVRPTNAIVVIGVAAYLLVCDRRALVTYLATGAAWLFAFVTYSEMHFSKPLPGYYSQNWITFARFWKPLAAHLVSPGRGLFVYVPVAAFVVFLTLRHRRALPHPRLVLLAYGVIALHLVAISGFSMWYAGVAYGPRYMTGVVPWLFLLGVLGVRAMLDRAPLPRFEIAVGLALSVLSVLVQARGAISADVWRWNSEPPIEIYPDEKVWNWRAPQFAAGHVAGGVPDVPPVYVLGSTLALDAPESDPFVRAGFSTREPGHRWTDGKQAELVFGVDRVDGRFVLELETGAFVRDGRVPQQRVEIELNDAPVATLYFYEPAPRHVVLPLRSGLLAARNRLVFRLPDAVTPASVGEKDTRMIGLSFQRLRIGADARESATR